MASRQIRIVAGLEVIGAAVGIVGVAFVGLRSFGPVAAGPLVSVAASGFFAGLGVAGILLGRGHPLGVPLSLAFQLVQVPALTSTFLTYDMVSPGTVSLSFDSAWNVGVQATVGSDWVLVFGHAEHPSAIAINLLAIACALVLWRGRRGLTSA